MTADDIIQGVLEREGGWRDKKQRPDGSWDPATNFGITLDTYLAWTLKPIVTERELRTLAPSTAAAIYRGEFIDKPGFTQANVPFEPLRVQLIDFGVNSGPERAIRWLQRTLGMRDGAVDGRLGPRTVRALDDLCSDTHGFSHADQVMRLLNDALVAARCEMIREAIEAGHIAKSDELGLLRRAVSFTLTKS